MSINAIGTLRIKDGSPTRKGLCLAGFAIHRDEKHTRPMVVRMLQIKRLRRKAKGHKTNGRATGIALPFFIG